MIDKSLRPLLLLLVLVGLCYVLIFVKVFA